MSIKPHSEPPLKPEELPKATPESPVWLVSVSIIEGKINWEFAADVLFDGNRFFNSDFCEGIADLGIKFVVYKE